MCLSTQNDDVALESVRRQRCPTRRVVSPVEATTEERPTAVHRHQVKGVTFSASSQNQIHLIPTALSCLMGLYADGTKQDLWYQRTDIQAFRREAQVISKRLRDERASSSSTTTYIDDSDKDDNDGSRETRGLEVRMSLHRQDRKQHTTRRILTAQDEDATPEEMAQIAGALSVWPQKMAAAQAHQDFVGVYHPHLLLSNNNNKNNHKVSSVGTTTTAPVSSIQPLLAMPMDCRRELVHKRSLTNSPMEPTAGRRVRCRMY